MKDRFGGLFCVCLWLVGSIGALAQQPAPAPEPGQNPPSPGPTTRLPPPLPPRPPDEYMPDEGKLSVGVWGWLGRGQPIIDAGPVYGNDFFGNKVHIPVAPPSRLTFQGQPNLIGGADLTIPVIKRNQLRISYFRTNASGNIVAPTDLLLWGGSYAKGDYLSTSYRLQNVKVSYEFVTWPFPIGSRKVRLKTLWQFQYTHMTTAFDAPLKSTDNGPNTASGNKTLYAPTLGLGIDYYVTPHFRVEANGTGFMIPHRWTIWDTDASMAYRVGKVELRLGGKAFHFRTSPKSDYYLRGTLAGAFVGVRFFFN
ncbi:MAG TPA: hypothetical protein VGF16_07225 [Bryobacteraceae bacterium]